MANLSPLEILNPPGTKITDPFAQIKKLYSKPSFDGENQQEIANPPMHAPQIYRGHRKKFGRTYINILHDPRVVRGNTYAAFVIPSSLQMEFLRMKEEEEKRRKFLKYPKKLPRVALMGNKKNLRAEDEKSKLEKKKPDSPILKPIENNEEIDDKYYFFEDKAEDPKYVPLPAGKNEKTQIIDGDLFDFDLEVKPVLEVLVGRSVIQAQYELIEEYERDEYLKHKKRYEKKREFELNKLQRIEAKYVRKEEENKEDSNKKNKEKLMILFHKKN